MILYVGTIPLGRSSQKRTVTQFDGANEWPGFADGLHCAYDLDRTQNEIVIRISFQGRVVLSCARCLTDFECPLNGVCTVIARCREGSEEIGYIGDDSSEYVYDADKQEVDLGQAVFDEVMIGLPMKPLCREDCPGVDDTVLKDSFHSVDPRWEALRKLKK